MTSAAAVAAVSLAVLALESVAPVLSLGALYLLAVLPVAALYGTGWGLAVSVASMVVFNWFFLPPTHTLRLADSENWVALAVYLFTAVVVSELATRLRRQAAESEQRRAEAAFAAEISRLLLERPSVEAELREIAARAAELLGAERGRIELGSRRRPDPGWSAYDLDAGSRHVGRLFLEGGRTPDDVAARVPPMLASVLASALDREQLARQARDAESRLAREETEAEALRRSDAAKTAVLRSVSHDLRSPLTAIGTLGELLESARAVGARAARARRRDPRARRTGSTGSSRTSSTSRGSRPAPRARAGAVARGRPRRARPRRARRRRPTASTCRSRTTRRSSASTRPSSSARS